MNFVPKVKLELVVTDAAAAAGGRDPRRHRQDRQDRRRQDLRARRSSRRCACAPARPATKPCERDADTSMQGTETMRLLNKLPWLGAGAGAPAPALAQEATDAAPPRPSPRSVSNINSGDIAWMLTSTLLVLFMILPGLALFYGGLVRAKNMLSVLMQCTMITALVMVDLRALRLLVVLRRLGRAPFWGGLGKVFLAGVTPGLREAGTIPELRLHRLPDDLRLHHPGADRRRLRRADEVLGGGAVRDPLGDVRLLPDRPHGLGRQRASTSAGARSTSPAARWCTSTPASRRWSARW